IIDLSIYLTYLFFSNALIPPIPQCVLGTSVMITLTFSFGASSVLDVVSVILWISSLIFSVERPSSICTFTIGIDFPPHLFYKEGNFSYSSEFSIHIIATTQHNSFCYGSRQYRLISLYLFSFFCKLIRQTCYCMSWMCYYCSASTKTYYTSIY